MSFNSNQDYFGRITAKTQILAVIGDPIAHSMSPTMHNAAIKALGIDYVYVAFHVHGNDLKSACDGFRALKIKGINVTIPHKVNIMKYLDEIDPIAQGIGAINTIKNENGRLIAKNTDAEGALKSLLDAGFNPEGKKCLILGCGGAARAISFILSSHAKEIVLTDINPQFAQNLLNNLVDFCHDPKNKVIFKKNTIPKIKTISYSKESLSDEISNSDLLINASPVGMEPETNRSPLDGFNFTLPSSLFVFDCVYNPMQTKFLKDAKSNGCKTLEGIHMLVNQGAIAFEWWTGMKADVKIMKEAAISKLNLK